MADAAKHTHNIHTLAYMQYIYMYMYDLYGFIIIAKSCFKLLFCIF